MYIPHGKNPIAVNEYKVNRKACGFERWNGVNVTSCSSLRQRANPSLFAFYNDLCMVDFISVNNH